MKDLIRISLTALIFLMIPGILQAQEIEMADTMRSEGKIYVIVGIILIVLAGLITYLSLLDRKVKKLEDRLK